MGQYFAIKMSYANIQQEGPIRMIRKYPTRRSYKNDPQKCSTKVTEKNVLRECPIKIFCKNIFQYAKKCATKITHKRIQ